ncbi:SPOR domain-containing protein [Gemmobacter lanyuensis]
MQPKRCPARPWPRTLRRCWPSPLHPRPPHRAARRQHQGGNHQGWQRQCRARQARRRNAGARCSQTGRAPAPAKAAATPAKPAASGTHLVQIGIFSVEANAKRATDALSKAGVSATLRKGQTQGKDHWSVTASGADKAALLAKVKSLGFTDAYIIK